MSREIALSTPLSYPSATRPKLRNVIVREIPAVCFPPSVGRWSHALHVAAKTGNATSRNLAPHRSHSPPVAHTLPLSLRDGLHVSITSMPHYVFVLHAVLLRLSPCPRGEL